MHFEKESFFKVTIKGIRETSKITKSIFDWIHLSLIWGSP